MSGYNVRIDPKLKTIKGVEDLLDKCHADLTELTGVPVSFHVTVKFHVLGTDDLIRIVCDTCEVTWDKVRAGDRHAQFVIARSLFCYFAYNVQRKSHAQIADILGFKDHTPVLHLVNKVDKMKSIKDDLYLPLIYEIESRINHVLANPIKILNEAKA